MVSSSLSERGQYDGGSREIHPGGNRAAPRPGEGVKSEVALEMKDGFPGYIAQLRELDGTQAISTCFEARHIIKRRIFMLDGPLIPYFPISLKVLFHKSPD